MRCDYDGKIEEMLETGTYAKLRGDPTAAQENSWSRKIKGMEKNQEITSSLGKKLRPTGSQLLGLMACPRSISLMCHSDPLFHS